MSVQASLFDGLAERNRIIESMRQNHKIYLTALRSFARVHAMQHGEVTIDDVRDAIAREQYPMPAEVGCDERVFGSLFTTKEFAAIGQRPTRREEWAKRVGRARSFVTVYRLKPAA